MKHAHRQSVLFIVLHVFGTVDACLLLLCPQPHPNSRNTRLRGICVGSVRPRAGPGYPSTRPPEGGRRRKHRLTDLSIPFLVGISAAATTPSPWAALGAATGLTSHPVPLPLSPPQQPQDPARPVDLDLLLFERADAAACLDAAETVENGYDEQPQGHGVVVAQRAKQRQHQVQRLRELHG